MHSSSFGKSRKSSAYSKRIYRESGWPTLVNAAYDVKILCCQRIFRYFGYGSTALILTLYLSELGFSDKMIGNFMTFTLMGDVPLSLLLTLVADCLGRRLIIRMGSILMITSGVVFAMSCNYWLLLLASVVGVISPSGNEIGPFKAIEESVMSQLVPTADRSDIFAWYFLLGTVGMAAGNLCCGWLVQLLQDRYSWTSVAAMRSIFWAYASFGVAKFLLSLILTPACEQETDLAESQKPIPTAPNDHTPLLIKPHDEDPEACHQGNSRYPSTISSLISKLSKESHILLLRFAAIFIIDNIASGIMPVSWLTYYFSSTLHTPSGALGSLFFASKLTSAASNLLASPLARFLGYIPSMTVTNLLSALALGLIPLPHTVVPAATLVLLRAITDDMDQAPRQALLVAAFLPGERTVVLGVLNAVKTLAQALGPSLSGALAGKGRLKVAFGVAAGLKGMYGVLLYGVFAGYRTREDLGRSKDGHEGEREVEAEVVPHGTVQR